MCPPVGVEYLRAHRALRELAHRLTSDGWHVLRFDYHGTGDSGGSAEDATVEQWLQDVGYAFDEAKEASEGGTLAAVGVRLGATLAAVASGTRRDVDALVLWDPVVAGRDHIAELAERHRAFILARSPPRGYEPADPPSEVLGTPLTTTLRSGLEALDLRTDCAAPPARVAVISSASDPEAAAIGRHLEERGARVDFQSRPGPRIWLRQDELERAQVPQATLGAIAAWLSA